MSLFHAMGLTHPGEEHSPDPNSTCEVCREAGRTSESGIHYHHFSGMGGGYMPDGHGIYDSFEAAVTAVREDVLAASDDSDGPARIFTEELSKPNGLWVGYYPEDVSPHDLGWYFEVFQARDDAPDHEDCRAILNGEKEPELW